MTRLSSPQTQSFVKSAEHINQCIKLLKKRISELQEFNPTTLERRHSPKQVAIQTSIAETLSKIYGHDTTEYRRYASAARLDSGPISVVGSWAQGRGVQSDLQEAQRYVTEGKERALALLNQAVRGLEEELEFQQPAMSSIELEPSSAAQCNKIFIVHGHEQGPIGHLARFLEQCGFEPIILHEKVSSGRTLIDKFEHHANVGFAIILLTPDDIGGAKGESLSSRARQNVILELGYFIGKLGRNKVLPLKIGELELPSDILGIAWTDFDDAGAWKMKLGQELHAAGYNIDWNKIMMTC